MSTCLLSPAHTPVFFSVRLPTTTLFLWLFILLSCFNRQRTWAQSATSAPGHLYSAASPVPNGWGRLLLAGAATAAMNAGSTDVGKHVTTAMPNPHPDYDALVDLYNATNGPNWDDNDNWLSGSNPCGWIGVNCTNDRVTLLDLNNNELIGSIPASLSALTNLTQFYLYGNQLSGPIPASLGALTSLTAIGLHENQLSGPIPASLGNLINLKYLTLRNNQLSGTIPASLGNLINLISLSLSDNQLSNPIPASLSALTNLTVLALSKNQLSGLIPASLSALTTLQYLYLGDNQLSGSIPASLGSLTNLINLELFGNQLSGPIPASLGALTSLEVLSLPSNQLSGSIPTSLGALANLRSLYLFNNQLSGSIPANLSALTNLVNFEMYNNDLSGPIPAGLGALAKLQYLTLYGNQLSGPIPASLGNLTNLTNLNLGENQLSGPIPASLGSLTNLITLIVRNNQLSGCFPASLSALCGGNRFIRFSGNPGLPGAGDFATFCATGVGSCSSPNASFAITSVTPVSCLTLSAGLRQVTFTPQYAGSTGQPVSFSVVNELSPTTSPGPYALNLYADNPTVILQARQGNDQTSFAYDWLAACGPATPPTGLAITGVTTVSCLTLSPGKRQVSFTPSYSGLTADPLSFSVVNELLPTTSPGPYSLQLYTDNPTITLRASQGAQQVSYSYNWLATCGSSARRSAPDADAGLRVRVLGNPVQNQALRVQVEGVAGRSVRLQLTDLRGQPVAEGFIGQAGVMEETTLSMGSQRAGVLLLRVSTPTQVRTLKVVVP